MADTSYWVISYRITFRSDYHVGDGTSLLGGNLYGLRADENGFPYMPHTQVKGLLRLGGQTLVAWHPGLKGLFKRNFPEGGKSPSELSWSFTRAVYPPTSIRGASPAIKGLFGTQTHIRAEEGAVRNLFAFQKGKGAGADVAWEGRIYSVEPAEESDVAFLVACMRAEDRMGRRRSRGYGKIDWTPRVISRFGPGDKKSRPVVKDLEKWISEVIP
jgi:hypothetical protein